MADPPVRFLVLGFAHTRQVIDGEVPKRFDSERHRRSFTRRASILIDDPTGRTMSVRNDDKECEPRFGKCEGNHRGFGQLAINEHRRVRLTGHRRCRVDHCRRRAHHVVFCALARVNQIHSPEVDFPQVIHRNGDGTRDRRRGPEIRASGDIGIDHDVQSGCSPARTAECPQHAKRNGRPAAHGPWHTPSQFHRGRVTVGRDDAHPTVIPNTDGDDHAEVDCNG